MRVIVLTDPITESEVSAIDEKMMSNPSMSITTSIMKCCEAPLYGTIGREGSDESAELQDRT
jgi:hypothetical protein